MHKSTESPSNVAKPPHTRTTYQSGIASAIRASSRAPANTNGGEGRRSRSEARCEEEERGTPAVFIARVWCTVGEVHQRRSSPIAGVRSRIREQCRQRAGPRGECTLHRQLARRALPRYSLDALRIRHHRWRKRETARGREEEERARGRRKNQREQRRLTVDPGSTCRPERALCSRVRPAYFSNLEFILIYYIQRKNISFSPAMDFSTQRQYTTL